MTHAGSVFIVAPRLDAAIDPAWPTAVAGTPGVTVAGDAEGDALLGSLRVIADEEAAARLRGLFGGALRVEEIRPRRL